MFKKKKKISNSSNIYHTYPKQTVLQGKSILSKSLVSISNCKNEENLPIKYPIVDRLILDQTFFQKILFLSNEVGLKSFLSLLTNHDQKKLFNESGLTERDHIFYIHHNVDIYPQTAQEFSSMSKYNFITNKLLHYIFDLHSKIGEDDPYQFITYMNFFVNH